jgi:hypothetical protein
LRGEPVFVLTDSSARHPSYRLALQALAADGAPFLVGGALAVAAYAGVGRDTKDLDVFVAASDVPRVVAALSRAGFAKDVFYPHWLAKMRSADGHTIDVIFNSGNGAAPVDDEWFSNAVDAVVFDVPVGLCPAEEIIWSKAFVMERERFDGGDIAHLLLACAETLDWPRLMRRCAAHWRVLFAHLILFGYSFPDAAGRVPAWVMEELEARLRSEPAAADTPRLCRGTFLSREQYLADLDRGWRDARLEPPQTMSPDAIAKWTAAIERH